MLSFENVTIDCPNKNKRYRGKLIRLVDNVSGSVEDGELLAIMGPSGCGKSTFLQALAGRIQTNSETSGCITYHGKQRDPREWTNNIGFADQDDAIFENLTVYQTLFYAAKFKQTNLTNAEINEKIEDILKMFRLENVVYNKMLKVSGGERKRVMLGVELIKDCKIMFFDEPTSGLDTKTALLVIKVLKDLTKKGRMVVISIHQPSTEIFEQFDKLMLMSNTKNVYFGLAKDCQGYLESKGITKPEKMNFPDFISELCAVPDQFDNADHCSRHSLQLIKEFDEKHPKNSVVHVQKSNQRYSDYRLSFVHGWNISARELKMEFSQKGPLIKKMLKLVFLVLMLYLKYLGIYFIRKVVLFANKDTAGSNLLELSNQIHLVLQKYTLVYSVLMDVGTICIHIGATSLYMNKNVVRREVRCGHYTAPSYFLGLYLYNLVYCYFTAILYVTFCALLDYKFFTYTAAILVLFGPPVFSLVGMSFSYIFQNAKAASILSTLFVLMIAMMEFFFPIIDLAAINYLKGIFYEMFFYSKLVLQLIPLNIMLYLATKSQYDAYFEILKKNTALAKKLPLKLSYFFHQNNFLGNFLPNTVVFSLILMFTIMFLFGFSINGQSRFLNPHLRMKLETRYNRKHCE